MLLDELTECSIREVTTALADARPSEGLPRSELRTRLEPAISLIREKSATATLNSHRLPG